MILTNMVQTTYQSSKTLLLLFLLCIVCPIQSHYNQQQQQQQKVQGNLSSSSSRISNVGATLAAVASTKTTFVGGSQSSRRKLPIQQVYHVSSSIKNLCSKDRDMKLVCHCSPEDYIHIKATKADCWIFHDDFPEHDLNWLAFDTQLYIEDLKITIQRTGHLGYIPVQIMQKLKYLKALDISYGQISNIPTYAFGNLTQIRQISLENNQIKYVFAYAFANHPDLEEISLEQNYITDIDKMAFVNVPSLVSLNMAKNNLTQIHDDVFAELRKLIDLRLESNTISSLTREMFKGLGNLRNLRLSYNNLNFIGDTVFAELWGLEQLDLDNNNIEKISERAFDGLNVLKQLRLEDNKLLVLEQGVFTGVPALKYLDLSNNRLETITFVNILPLWDNLVNASSTLDLTENRLVCDCRLKWVFELRQKTKHEDMRQSLQRIECRYDDASSSNTHVIDNTLLHQPPHGPNDDGQYEDEPAYEADLARGNVIQLLHFGEEQLPCPQRLIAADPTELPLPRESIGMDLSWRSPETSGGDRSHVNFFILLLCLTVPVSVSPEDKATHLQLKCQISPARLISCTISNRELHDRYEQKLVKIEVKRRKLGWVGHTLRRDADHISKRALFWNPQGLRRRGALCKTWRRIMEAAIRTIDRDLTMRAIATLATNRQNWREITATLCL
ncbi:connectin-like [Culicoides brevitarsis]|uniref:connectin-like n=1 Tax=Culicoides brevitarsis TaxID=469753 RepID=UPI00307B4E4F